MIPVKQVFNAYLDGVLNAEELIIKLREIEMQVMSDHDFEDEEEVEVKKGLWFRFFKGDTEGLTIDEIEKDLNNPGHPNYNILKHGMAIGLASDELEVHYE
jgi:translation initiation factor RLI1